jgi:hypothetical protein
VVASATLATASAATALLYGIFRDSENREVWSRLHGTKAFRTSDPQDEDADNLEAHVSRGDLHKYGDRGRRDIRPGSTGRRLKTRLFATINVSLTM